MFNKQFRNILVFVKYTLHQRLLNLVQGAACYRNSRCHTHRLIGEASFTKKFTFVQNCDDRFFALLGYDGELYFASSYKE